MSANAFDEDIQKSLDAGMNAHMIKDKRSLSPDYAQAVNADALIRLTDAGGLSDGMRGAAY